MMNSNGSCSSIHNPDTIEKEEETRHGFDSADCDKTIAGDSDSDLSQDDVEDSSCSADMIHHTVNADLYGTDKDPNYNEEPHSLGIQHPNENNVDSTQLTAEGPRSKPQQQSSGVRSSDFNSISAPPGVLDEPYVVLERLDGQPSANTGQNLTEDFCQADTTVGYSSADSNTRQELGTSQSQILTACEMRNVAVGDSDANVYQQSYDDHCLDQNGTGSRSDSPAPVYHLQHLQDLNTQNQQAIEKSTPHQIVNHQQEQLHHLKTSYHANNLLNHQQEDAYKLQMGQPQTDHGSAVEYNKPGSRSEPSTPVRQKLCMGADGKQYVRLPASYRDGFTEEESMAAEQLASELVKTYGGQNSLMISEMLKESTGDGGQENGYVYSGFERPSELVEVPNSAYNTPQMINDVLNTPNQLSHIGDVEDRGMPGPRMMNYHQSSPWIDNNNNQAQSHNSTEISFQQQRYMDKYGPGSNGQFLGRDPDRPISNMSMKFPRSPQFELNQFIGASRNHFNDPCQSRNASLFTNTANVNSACREMGQSTKTTFVSREHMEMHLNDKLKYKVGQNQNATSQMSDINCSSIYPSRDFIERTAGGRSTHVSSEYGHESMHGNDKHQSNTRLPRPDQSDSAESRRPLKKRRISKYSTDELRVPPQTPLYEDVMKYAPVCNREDMQGSRHKYFVVNPSEVTNMPPKALITKYIDFLIGENEQITEISKSMNPPVDIYVTEDMYFMDSLKFMAPFPSKKFMEWVANFYPCLDLFEMKFKGRTLTMPTQDEKMKVDNRPTEQVLEDTFYFFQREAMGMRN